MTPQETPTDSTEHQLLNYLRGRVAVAPRGGKTLIADEIGISLSGLSKMLERNSGMHLPTAKTIFKILDTDDRKYEGLLLLEETKWENLIFRIRVKPDGTRIQTWLSA